MYYRVQKMNAFVDYSSSMREANEFGSLQHKYFNDYANNGFEVNTGLKRTALNGALHQPDLYLPKSPDKDFQPHFEEDMSQKYRDFENNFCKIASSPKDFPARSGNISCGWYFYDSSDIGSFGAIGTKEGPLLDAEYPPGGIWIWSIEEALQKEEIKNCMRVKSCSLISDMDEIRGKCGFCNNKGYSVPIEDNGNEKYPFLESSCGDKLILDSSLCDIRKPEPILTSDGTSCGTYGKPSSDNTRREYTKDDCDNLQGLYMPNGDCLSKSNLIFNEECRQLNTPAVIQSRSSITILERQKQVQETAASPLESDYFSFQDPNADSQIQNDFANETICTPNAKGNLTPSCLISIAKGVGLKDSGLLITLLKYGTKPDENQKMALDIILNSGIQLTQAVLGRGDIDKASAANIYNTVYKAMTQGKTQLIKAAATILVSGNYDLFDPCNDKIDQTYAKSVMCLQRAFRQVGCQASGYAYPTKENVGRYTNMSLINIITYFKDLYDTMTASDPETQDEAAAQCLGLTFYRNNFYWVKKPQSYIDGGLINLYDIINKKKCIEDCTKNPACKAYVINETGGGLNNGNFCSTHDNSSNILKYWGSDMWYKVLDTTRSQGRYEEIKNKVLLGRDIACFPDKEADFCMKKCDIDSECAMVSTYNNPGGSKGCCTKYRGSPLVTKLSNTTYIKRT
jgi:hypothetical protein